MLLLAGALALAGCNLVQYNAEDLSVDQVMSHEWISFHVDKFWLEGKTVEPTEVGYDIVIHNINDSVQEIASFCNDGDRILITPQWAKYVNTPNYDVAFYRNLPDSEVESQWYDDMVCMVLQYGINYFPMYYPTYSEWCLVKMPEKSSHYKMMDDGKTVRVKATCTQKHCYADHCELVDDPITLYYDTERQMFVSSQHKGKWPNNWGFRYEIRDMRFDNRQALLDSVFDLEHPRYAGYERSEGKRFIPHRYGSRNTEMTDTVLDFPLVHLRTGDTTTLRQMQGTTLLCRVRLRMNHRDYYLAPDAYAPQVQNTLMLFTESSNVELMRGMADSLGLADNLYYAKGINIALDLDYNTAYLITPDHKTLSAMPYDKHLPTWIEETLNLTTSPSQSLR